MTLIERVIQHLEAEASEEQKAIGRYAERYINALTNYELLKLLSDVSEAKEPT
ncbi:hypothetical protein D3C80_1387030 [compost metagenome]